MQLRNIWSKIGLSITGALAIVSCFLPLRSFNGESFGSFSQDQSGAMAIGASIVMIISALLAIFIKKRPITITVGIVAIICSLIIAFVAKMGYDTVNSPLLTTDMGIGGILMIISAILAFVFSILVLVVKPKE